MSETPPGTDVPDLGDTPGPEATAEQEASVSSLLGMLRADDVPMPEDVIRRIDAALAQERRTPVAPARGGPSSLGSAEDRDPGWVAPVTVLPAGDAASRRSRSARTLRILGGAAAAVVVGIVGISVIGHGLGGSTTSASSRAPEAAPSVAAAGSAGSNETLVRSSGTAYTTAGLTSQVTALVAEAKSTARTPLSSDATSPVFAGASPGTGNDSATGTGGTAATTDTDGGQISSPAPVPSAAGARAGLTESTVAACVLQLAGRSDVTALAVDHGTWAGKPADVVVLPTDGDPGTVDVWVLAPGCTATSAEVYLFKRVPVS